MALSSPRARGARPADATGNAGDCVIVVHGLWLTGAVMARFCARLRQAGLRTYAFSYPSLRRGTVDNVAALGRFISTVQADRIYIAAHSLGGLISLLYVQAQPDPRLTRMVLLGAPVRGSSVARRLAASPIGRALLGKAEWVLTAGVRLSLPEGLSIGVIAGTLGLGLGRLMLPLRGAHDGTVQVDETRWPQAADFITLPVSHTGMMFSARVAAAVVSFLRTGRFKRESE